MAIKSRSFWKAEPAEDVVCSECLDIVAYANKVSNVTFNHFVVSLATTAAVHFGEVKDPDSGRSSPINLEAAGRAIEMLVLLEEKTRGNLTEDEAAFLQQVLYELRNRYLGAKQSSDESLDIA